MGARQGNVRMSQWVVVSHAPIIEDDHIGLYAGQSYMVIFDDRGKAAR